MSEHTARLQFSFAIVQGAACLFALQLPAQAATGKLEGRVANQTGVPLGDVQVHLVGSAFGAETDDHGYYFINNVPAGTYQVRAVLIGFQPLQITGLRILSDQTTTQDFTLTVAAVQLREITVLTAENPLVPRDEVTNCGFGGDDLKTLYITGGGTLYSIRTTTAGRVIWPTK